MKNKLYKKVRNRIILEQLLRFFIISFSISLILVAISLVIAKLLPYEMKWYIYLISGSSVFTLLMAILLAINYPKAKDIAKRADYDFNLKEQMLTANEFKNDTSNEMVQIQREVAYKNFNSVKKAKMSFRFSYLSLIALPIAIIALTSAAYLPYREVSIEDPIEENNQNELQDKVDDLIEDVDNADLDENTKEEIKDILNDLKQDLGDEKKNPIKEIEDAINDLQNKIDSEVTKDEVGESLIENNQTELGEAIKNGDADAVDKALDNIKDELSNLEGEELDEALDKLEQDLNNVEQDLEGMDDALSEAIKDFANDIEKANDDSKTDEMKKEEVNQAIEDARENIKNALEEQNKLEQELEDLKKKLEEMMQEIDGEKMEMEEPPEGMEGMPKPDDEDQSSDEDMQPGDIGTGELVFAEDELIYNPETNSYIKYGDLLSTYYAIVNGQMAETEVSDSTIKLIYEYFGYLFYEEDTNEDVEGGNTPDEDMSSEGED